MTSKLTREKAQQIIDAADAVISALAGTNDEVHKDDTDKMVRLWDDLNDRYAPPEVVRELARMALAAIDSEPVAWVMLEDLADKDIVSTPAYPDINDAMEMTHGELEPLYRHAQQPVVPDIDELRLAFEAAERESDDGFNLHKYGIGYADDETQGRWDTWLACRAAMLNGGKS